MGIHDLTGLRHEHAFDSGNRAGERRTWLVVGITAVTMVAEIVAGIFTGSMALLADGWHMATHGVALSIAGFSYLLARRLAGDERFAFGTWKIEVLGAFTSALLLAVVAGAMVWESVHRFLQPEPVNFAVALWVAVVGLAVNVVSALVLGGAGHGHGHGAHAHDAHHDHGPGHDHGAHAQAATVQHEDLNLRSAYVHVVTDAFTSVLAIMALAAGLWLGWGWMDPAMGIVGSVVIAWWARGLIVDSARVLLDREMDSPLVPQVRAAIQSDGDAEIADLHLWRVGRDKYAAVMTVVADKPLTPADYRARLSTITALAHVSVEVNRCPQGDCPP